MSLTVRTPPPHPPRLPPPPPPTAWLQNVNYMSGADDVIMLELSQVADKDL